MLRALKVSIFLYDLLGNIIPRYPCSPAPSKVSNNETLYLTESVSRVYELFAIVIYREA